MDEGKDCFGFSPRARCTKERHRIGYFSVVEIWNALSAVLRREVFNLLTVTKDDVLTDRDTNMSVEKQDDWHTQLERWDGDR
mmetsp:Transcript_3873/g.6839  ORF Transcript_3873/g.6839 Transcript_3873/m.6839 type:complete len:82 (-) Transcript_3873:120-365(-)